MSGDLKLGSVCEVLGRFITDMDTQIDTINMVVTDMPAILFNKLSEKLCRRDQHNWKKLAIEIPFLTRNDVIRIGKMCNPGEAILQVLQEEKWTVQQLDTALKRAGLDNLQLQENYDMVVTDMPAVLLNKLSEKLCRRDQHNWKKLAIEIPFLTRNDVIRIGKKSNPGEELLDVLGEKKWTVEQLATALQRADLQNEQKMLQENYDLAVTDMPVTLFNKLSEKLCRRDQHNWKNLANEIPFLTRNDVIRIGKKSKPGKALLDVLGEKEWTVQQLATALERAGFQKEQTILEDNYDIGSWKMAPTAEKFVQGQQGYVNSATVQEPVRQQQQEQLLLLNQSQSSVGRSRSETELTVAGHIKQEQTNTSASATAGPEPQWESSACLPINVSQGACSEVSSDDNGQEMLMRDTQSSPKMLNTTKDTTTSEGQSHEEGNEDAKVNVITQVEDDPLGKKASHNADIDRLYLIQDVHKQDLQNSSLSHSFRDIHNGPGHVVISHQD